MASKAAVCVVGSRHVSARFANLRELHGVLGRELARVNDVLQLNHVHALQPVRINLCVVKQIDAEHVGRVTHLARIVRGDRRALEHLVDEGGDPEQLAIVDEGLALDRLHAEGVLDRLERLLLRHANVAALERVAAHLKGGPTRGERMRLLYDGCATAVRRLCDGCATAVRRLCDGCATAATAVMSAICYVCSAKILGTWR